MGMHTQTPWTTFGTVIRADRPTFDNICTMQVSNCPNWEETRDFIVRACNAHDDLVAALRGLAAAVEAGGRIPTSDWHAVCAALAKASA